MRAQRGAGRPGWPLFALHKFKPRIENTTPKRELHVDELLPGGFLFSKAFEGFSLQLAALLHEDLDLAFCGFEFLPARVGQSNAFLKQLQRLFERQVSAFELFDYLFELLQAVFKLWQGGLRNDCMTNSLAASTMLASSFTLKE